MANCHPIHPRPDVWLVYKDRDSGRWGAYRPWASFPTVTDLRTHADACRWVEQDIEQTAELP